MSSYRNSLTGIAALLLGLLPVVLLAPSAASKGADAIPAGDLKIVVSRQSGALSIGEVLFDPGLQVVLSEVHAFYATHDAAQTTPQQLAAALAPNHAAVTTLEARDEYVFVSESIDCEEAVLHHWRVALVVEDVLGEEDPVIVTLDVQRAQPLEPSELSVGIGSRCLRVGTEQGAQSREELLADSSVRSVQEQVMAYLRMIQGSQLYPAALAAYLETWSGATEVTLSAPTANYRVWIDPVTGETLVICEQQQGLTVETACGVVTTSFQDLMPIL